VTWRGAGWSPVDHDIGQSTQMLLQVDQWSYFIKKLPLQKLQLS